MDVSGERRREKSQAKTMVFQNPSAESFQLLLVEKKIGGLGGNRE